MRIAQKELYPNYIESSYKCVCTVQLGIFAKVPLHTNTAIPVEKKYYAKKHIQNRKDVTNCNYILRHKTYIKSVEIKNRTPRILFKKDALDYWVDQNVI